ncbi:unnamed protein product [Anisakis simplex]|uniref:Uncharacterized protein n=1 Tax=Anisakis simplex TaxID=6269 RepID=A0A3P6S358_ANISI|nr:unnamed protein product [Anisakis simplex]
MQKETIHIQILSHRSNNPATVIVSGNLRPLRMTAVVEVRLVCTLTRMHNNSSNINQVISDVHS